MKYFTFLNEFAQGHRALIKTVGRFLVAGTIGATTNISGLFILTEYVGLHYLVSACISFVLAVCVGFSLQKFWTFRERSIEGVHAQAAGYFTISGINFFINIVLLYVLVEKLHLWYIFGQIIASALIAVSSFLLYRHVIFLQKGNVLE